MEFSVGWQSGTRQHRCRALQLRRSPRRRLEQTRHLETRRRGSWSRPSQKPNQKQETEQESDSLALSVHWRKAKTGLFIRSRLAAGSGSAGPSQSSQRAVSAPSVWNERRRDSSVVM
eukprot:scaffold463_cov242-Pinguiococcus_pyrenoidosus.AAC.9